LIARREEFERFRNLAEERKLRRRLNYTYEQVPETTCRRKAGCCFNCAEVYLAEYANIGNFVSRLPDEARGFILNQAVHYELLSLVTLDYQCPFLRDKDCLTYEVRPLQCRFYGLYPDQEYLELMADSRRSNAELGRMYAEKYGLRLPEEALLYDVNQCPNNVDGSGKRAVVGSFERDRLFSQISSAQFDAFGDIDEEEIPIRSRFSLYLMMEHFTDDEQLRIKVATMKEYLRSGELPFLHEALKRMADREGLSWEQVPALRGLLAPA